MGRRIAHERETRNWSYEGLASRLTASGCQIQASAIYKIEKSDPPRRITVTELIGFSAVFGIPIQDLVLPLEVAVDRECARMVAQWDNAAVALGMALDAYDSAWSKLHQWSQANPGAALEKALSSLPPSQHRSAAMGAYSAVDWVREQARFREDEARTAEEI